MSITPLQITDPLQQLARAIFWRFDTNMDGKLTKDEFSSFLAAFVGAANSSPAKTGAATVAPLSAQPIFAPLEGFDFRKLDDPNVTTVKYRFARIARDTDLSAARTREGAETLLRGMVAEMQRAGITVLDVKGDKIHVLDDHGEEAWIDVIRAAGGDNPAWQWLDLRFC
jgi:hypothetical protein